MKQLLRITPMGKFFFGGNRNFSSTRQGYYAHSEYFPQQTALLGMLRYALLNREGLLDATKTEKGGWIGEFDFDGKNVRDFKRIKSLSPVFILEDQKSWIPAGKDHQIYYDQAKERRHFQLNYSEVANKSKLLGYNHKESTKNYFAKPGTSPSGKSDLIAIEEFFDAHQQVGITKAKDGKTLDDAFYKHQLLTFKRDKISYKCRYSFGLWVDADYDFNQITTVFLGRESVFKVEVEEVWVDFFNHINAENARFSATEPAKVVLLSNTYVEDLSALRSQSDFILADAPIPFKFIKSAGDGRHYAMPTDNSRKSAQRYMLERGSVIYPKDLAAVKELLDNEPYRNIGYNNYRILTR